MPTQLPIDDILPQILTALQSSQRPLVLEAPPGAGKTTRLPVALLDQDFCPGEVLVSEPRRIAARMAALRVAEERAEPLGKLIGYRVRFEEKASQQTRLTYMTEGLLLRRLVEDPMLSGVSAVVLDEIHERSADLDLILALLLRLLARRPELRLIAMSATLQDEALCAYFDQAQTPAQYFRSQGRAFPVEVQHATREEDRPLAIAVRSALHSVRDRAGDVLAFLPGEKEIRACQESLAAQSHFQVKTLFGGMNVQEQAQVLRPVQGERRVILSTNVAESSLTVPSVTTVVDSGLARIAVFDPWSGITRLETERISQARCIQRAGRAGRVAPGLAIRLYTSGQFAARPAQDTPEMRRTDLSALILRVLLAAERQDLSLEDLRFPSPPDPERLELANQLLQRLGAVREGQLTELGRSMAQLPLPPRLSRFAVEAARRGLVREGALAAALLSERDPLMANHGVRRDMESGDSDLEDRMERLEEFRQHKAARPIARRLDLDVRRSEQILSVAQSLTRDLKERSKTLTLSPHGLRTPERRTEQLRRCLLHGFFDRVALRKDNGSSLVLSDGLQVTLSESSCVTAGDLLLTLSTDAPGGRRRKAVARLVCRLEADWLLDEMGQDVEASETLAWNAKRERVQSVSQLRYGKLVLDESRAQASPGVEAGAILAEAAKAKGPAVFDPENHLERLGRRLQILRQHAKDFTEQLSDSERSLLQLSSEDRSGFSDRALEKATQELTDLATLKEQNLAELVAAGFSPELDRVLKAEVPGTVRLLGGHILPVIYEYEKPPHIASRLQDFFSMSESPHICFGRVPLSIHLLAPNHRPIQVTTDLGGFWSRHYPELRKQLMRRYPKHLWPEDGANARPPTPGRIR